MTDRKATIIAASRIATGHVVPTPGWMTYDKDRIIAVLAKAKQHGHVRRGAHGYRTPAEALTHNDGWQRAVDQRGRPRCSTSHAACRARSTW
jgi:hypothetical protein